MASLLIPFSIFLCAFSMAQETNALDNNFNSYYTYLWGTDHFSVNPQGTEVQLKMDQRSGAGFKSKADFGSGYFHIKMKIPSYRTGGIVTSFYLTAVPVNASPLGNHFEIDFEFLGTNGSVQTNVYDFDTGHREETFQLWFNPSQDFHSYDFLWNAHQIVFYIDKIPVRVFKNNVGRGIPFPSSPMHIEASIWNANWAGSVDWRGAPFIASYSDFGFSACEGSVSACASPRDSWNRYRDLTPAQHRQMEWYRKKYMIYDYCSNPSTRKKECDFN